MIDVAWKVGKGSQKGDWELRYGMRSVLANFQGLGKLWIVGHAPEWLDTSHERVRHIPWPDPYKSNKDANLIQKLIRLGMEPELTEKFLFMSDDYLILQPLQYEDCGPFYMWDCAAKSEVEWERMVKDNPWNDRLRRTHRACAAKGLPTFNWESHAPMPYLKSGTPELLRWDYGAKAGYTIQSLYYNANRVAGSPIPSDYRGWSCAPDTHPEQAVKLADDYKTLTFTPKGVQNWYVTRLVEQKFPDAAPWELTPPASDLAEKQLKIMAERLAALSRIIG